MSLSKKLATKYLQALIQLGKTEMHFLQWLKPFDVFMKTYGLSPTRMRAYPTPAMATHPSTSGTDVSIGRKGSGPRKTKQTAVMKLPMTERRTGLDKIRSDTYVERRMTWSIELPRAKLLFLMPCFLEVAYLVKLKNS